MPAPARAGEHAKRPIGCEAGASNGTLGRDQTGEVVDRAEPSDRISCACSRRFAKVIACFRDYPCCRSATNPVGSESIREPFEEAIDHPSTDCIART
jgi:hypothetical protein